MTATLFLVSTPIGNLGDFSDRAREAFQKAHLIACEDTRNTKKLIGLLGIETQADFLSYHEYNADKMRPILIEKLSEGLDIVLVSDAGTPLISDPGYRLVRDCLKAEIKVVPIPGANAVLPALQLSGLPSDRFMFVGFLETKTTARQKELSEFKTVPATLIFYESPHRVLETLKDMLTVLGDRPAAVVRELTKRFEESKIGLLSELIAFYEQNGEPKGEIVILVDRPSEKTPINFDIHAMLTQAMKNKTLRDAVDEVTSATGLDRRKIYKEAIEIKNG